MVLKKAPKVPDGVNDLPMCVPVASQLLHAAGIGMAMNIKGDKKVVMTYFGDGASSEGDCHEALNFAAVFNAPVVFICLNNQYAISSADCKTNEKRNHRAASHRLRNARHQSRWQRCLSCLHTATQEAIVRARNGEGPTLIECLTYRFTPHTTADDPKRYRSDDESKKWHLREPLLRFAKYLAAKGDHERRTKNSN